MSFFTDINRRAFMKNSGLLASSLMIPGSVWAGKSYGSEDIATEYNTTQYITPLILMNGATRLVIGSTFIHPSVKHCVNSSVNITTTGNAFYVGTQMPFGKDQLTDSLSDLKDKWDTGKVDEEYAKHLSLLSGALTYHRILDELADTNDFDEVAPSGNMENKIYQDACLINHYLTRGKEMGVDQIHSIQNTLREMLTRTFTRFHTLMPDEADGEAWIMNIIQWRKQLDQYFGELAEAIAAPDAQKEKKYIDEANFFKGGEYMLIKVSTFNKMVDIDRESAEEMINHETNTSHSAKAVAAAYSTLISINDFLTGNINRASFNTALNL